SSRQPGASETVVNTEWTIGGGAPPLNQLCITTKRDRLLYETFAGPRFPPFEYITRGRHIGGVVLLIFFYYASFVINVPGKDLPANLVQGYALSTTFLSSVVAQTPSDSLLVAKLNASLAPPESSHWCWDVPSARAFRKIARAVQTRSAGLIA